MMLLRITIENFGPLEHVEIDFSTDPGRPITVIRAETGKTSFLRAMLWAFFGSSGLSDAGREGPLATILGDLPVPVSVVVEFEHGIPGGGGRYRLIRSCSETWNDDQRERTQEHITVSQITGTGEAAIDGPEAFLRQVLPYELLNLVSIGSELYDLETIRDVCPLLHLLDEDRRRLVTDLVFQRFFEIVELESISKSATESITSGIYLNSKATTADGEPSRLEAELNLASRQALAVSLAWALLEVARVEAPRIMDSPFGMLGPTARSNLLESIATSSSPSSIDYQLILLLQRSEVRGVEQHLGAKTGIAYTLTEDFVSDLRYPWGHNRGVVRCCTCSFSQTCRVCALNSDLDGEFEHRDIEAIRRDRRPDRTRFQGDN